MDTIWVKMKFETKVKLRLFKRYFDTGYGETSQIKYLMIAMGAAWQNVKGITVVGVIYTLICFFIGWWMYEHQWIEAGAEVGNRYNPLAKELRKDMDKRKV